MRFVHGLEPIPTQCATSPCKNSRNMCASATAGVSSRAAVVSRRSSGAFVQVPQEFTKFVRLSHCWSELASRCGEQTTIKNGGISCRLVKALKEKVLFLKLDTQHFTRMSGIKDAISRASLVVLKTALQTRLAEVEDDGGCEAGEAWGWRECRKWVVMAGMAGISWNEAGVGGEARKAGEAGAGGAVKLGENVG